MELKILLTKHNIYHFGYCILYCSLVHPTDIYGIPIVRKILLLGSRDGSLGKTRTVFALMESMGTDHYQINHALKKLQIFFKDESEIPVFIGFPHSLQSHKSIFHIVSTVYLTIYIDCVTLKLPRWSPVSPIGLSTSFGWETQKFYSKQDSILGAVTCLSFYPLQRYGKVSHPPFQILGAWGLGQPNDICAVS